MKRSIIGLLCVQVWCVAYINAAPQADSDPAPININSDSRNREDTGSSHSITERFLESMRNPIGFSMGIFELYAPHSSQSTPADKSPVFTMMRPRVFAAATTKRSEVRLDYAFGYRRYNHRSEIHNSDHSARLDFDYRLSRNASLQISDTFNSSFNDRGSLPNDIAPTMYQPAFAQ